MNARPLVPALLTILLFGGLARAQGSAFLYGRVLDPSGASVPEAGITAVNEETGFRRIAVTETDGTYIVGSIESGLYKVTVRKPGFIGMIRFDVRVALPAGTRVDFNLIVGAVQETISVEGTAPLLSHEEVSIGARVYRDDIQRVPLNGRGMLGLLELSPGTNVTPATRGEAGQFTANGQRPNTNYFTVDGTSANTGVSAGGLAAQTTGGSLPALSAFGSLDSLLPLEAVDEFRVRTSTAANDVGRLPGATVAITSRTGSDDFHGAVAYRFRHEIGAANDWFANESGEGRAALRLQDVAPSLGGPIRRNRTFFFLAYQHMAFRGPYVSRQPVPSDATRAAALDWVLPAFSLYPEPNGVDLGGGLAAWNGRNLRPSEIDSGLARVDHSIGSRMTLFGRYSDSASWNEFGATEVNRLNLRFQSLTMGLNFRPSPAWTLDIRANESQADAESSWARPGQAFSSGCDLQPMTSFLFPQVSSCDALVRFYIGGVGQVVVGQEGVRRQRQFQYLTSAGWNHGAHAVRFGGDYRRIVPIRRDAMASLSAIADNITELTDKKNLWLGTSPALSRTARVTELSFWVQDTWRISQRLTITAGLRWEYSPSPFPEEQPYPYFLHPDTNTVYQDRQALWPEEYTNFAPKLSAAWRLNKSGSTVLRGGGGLYYDSSLSIATDLINSGPLSIQQLTSGIHGLFSSLLSYGFWPDLQLPRLLEWNLTLDQALTAHDVLSAGYVGSSGRRLLRREVGGAGSSPTALLALTTNHGSSTYEGLQVQYRRRVAEGLQALASYTWSHSLDDGSSDAFLLWAGPGASRVLDHASSDFDLRHALTATLTYELPRRGAGTGRYLGGWGLDALWRIRTGFPVTVLDNEQYQGIPLANAFRPNLVPGVPIWIDDASAPGGRRIDPAAFVAAPAEVQGTLGRNVIAGFGMSQVDLAVRREFHWRDRYALQVRMEAFNIANRPNFADPVKYLSSAVFGQSTSMLNVMLGTGSPGSGLAPLLQSGGPRNLQATLRFRF
ncbi:MAG TPA: TonB-dependent receptor [Candidatus Acidoferrales bacterium]|nr:TonB-dependent receptor [Candidatus Acidoferrales bacterium]